ncbi:hypothetical protein ONR70_04620 [Proteus mirabilis]|uniref:hypothetical protein n=1 Tax=Proteus mirabilis TaxID=584 RepID=UPI00222FA046|nr:hypothetical protein [Proteus mirabilis]UZE64611.1 hypothetical protein ONR70_04620 [Proteus mirabilis]
MKFKVGDKVKVKGYEKIGVIELVLEELYAPYLVHNWWDNRDWYNEKMLELINE